MDEYEMIPSLLLREAGGLPATAPLARAMLEWATAHADWLMPDRCGAAEAPSWEELLAAMAEPRPAADPPQVLTLADALARLLDLDTVDAGLLRAVIACDRLPRVGAPVALACRHGRDLAQLLGLMAGAEPDSAARVVRRSAVMRLGLATIGTDRYDAAKVEVRWALTRVLDRSPADDDALLELLAGRRAPAALSLADFTHVEPAGFLVRLLHGAVREAAPGINILIHGPPGTGKTELARTLAAAAGAALHGIGEADDDGEEPSRWERVSALSMTQRLM